MLRKKPPTLTHEEALWHFEQLQGYFKKLQTFIDAGGKKPNYRTTVGKWFEEVTELQEILGLEKVKHFKFLLLKYYFTLPAKGNSNILDKSK